MDDTSEDQFDLIDLDKISLADLSELDESAFAHSLHRVLAELDNPQEVVAGWNSAI